MFPYDNAVLSYLFSESCADGDVLLGKDAVPYYSKEGKFYPICGHGFWNNHYGADAFCQALGFTGGTLRKDRGKYQQDAVEIGICNPFNTIDRCDGGYNTYSFAGNCRVGNNVKVFIACDENTLGSVLSSCSGKTGKFYNRLGDFNMEYYLRPFTILYTNFFIFDRLARYQCTTGQGESGKSIDSRIICTRTKCEEECRRNDQCKAYDFTTKCKFDSCRLYGENTPTTDNGIDQRIYCKEVDDSGKIRF